MHWSVLALTEDKRHCLQPSSDQATTIITVISITSSIIATMVVYAVLILNKAGGLIYQRDFNPGLQKLSSNDYLILAGTFHGVHAITSQISPTNETSSSGLEVLESENFVMRCFQTLTGTKFLIFAEPRQQNLDVVVRKVYELYSDYVMKNPFYQIEMPIRSEGFDRHLNSYIKPHQ
ncbi:hypothetical protein TWF173_000412 [Orbilia oligospora]|nr:hypothetical protein TWF173_000412 [Orbilia oligospora]